MDKKAEGHSKQKELRQGFEAHLCSSFYKTDPLFKAVLNFYLSQNCHINFNGIRQLIDAFQKTALITTQVDCISSVHGASWKC